MSNKVLVITGSMISDQQSYSKALTKQFVKHYQTVNPNDEIIFLNLSDVPMALKTLTDKNFSVDYFNKDDSDYYIEQLKSINKVIISTPMTNFNVTSIVKNYLDHILVADKTFSYKYSKKGDAVGLLNHLKVQILTTQGAPYGWYLWGNHTRYLEGTWKFMGAKVNRPILICGTKVRPKLIKANKWKLLLFWLFGTRAKTNSTFSPTSVIEKNDKKIKKAANNF